MDQIKWDGDGWERIWNDTESNKEERTKLRNGYKTWQEARLAFFTLIDKECGASITDKCKNMFGATSASENWGAYKLDEFLESETSKKK